MTGKTMQEFNYYLFDADGTLFDTTEMIIRCFHNTARVFNLPVPTQEEIISHVGRTLRKQMEQYFGELSDDVFSRYRKVHMDYQLEIYRDHLRLCPGVNEALPVLQERGKKCAVVTSRMLPTLSVYLKETGIADFFSVLITPEATERHKPDPQPAHEALQQLGGRAEEALFVGDSLYDIACGNGAGTKTAFVTWSHNPVDTLQVTPDYLLADMRELYVW